MDSIRLHAGWGLVGRRRGARLSGQRRPGAGCLPGGQGHTGLTRSQYRVKRVDAKPPRLSPTSPRRSPATPQKRSQHCAAGAVTGADNDIQSDRRRTVRAVLDLRTAGTDRAAAGAPPPRELLRAGAVHRLRRGLARRDGGHPRRLSSQAAARTVCASSPMRFAGAAPPGEGSRRPRVSYRARLAASGLPAPVSRAPPERKAALKPVKASPLRGGSPSMPM